MKMVIEIWNESGNNFELCPGRSGIYYRIRVNATPSWIEPQATYFGRTVVIFGEKSSKITVFSDENLSKLTIVRGLKIQKINRTPGLQLYGAVYDTVG